MKKKFQILVLTGLLSGIQIFNLSAQNLENILIEKMENVSIVIPEKCNPEDLIVVINSSIKDLKFESNMLPDSDFIVTYYQETNQYIICHQKIKFKLTVSGPNLQSEEINIFDMDQPQAFKISANISKGQVNILTNPRNSTVIFPEFNDQAYSTNQPIRMVSGKFKVKIFKPLYQNVDTVVVVPNDAEKTYNIDLVPQFARIKLNLTTDDKMPFQKAPVIWIDSVKIDLDSYVKAGTNQRRFFDDVEFLKFYEGDIIPLKEGHYVVRIEAESYNSYKTSIDVQNGKIANLTVSLEPIYGFLTFIDSQFSEGATVYFDDQIIGKIPLFKLKMRVGTHKIRLEKKGFVSSKEEYSVTVNEGQNTDFNVSMGVAKKLLFETDPSNAEVIMDGERIGFTPLPFTISAGNHLLTFHKNGFASEKFTKLIDDKSPAEDTIMFKLQTTNPLSIKSEEEGLQLRMKGTGELKNIEIDSTLKTPAILQLPYGKYKVYVNKANRNVYHGTITHSKDLKSRVIPVYSKTSFQLLSANYISKDNFEGSFGRICMIPGTGLSTSIFNVEYKVTDVKIDSGNYSINYRFKTLAPYVFLLNWDWRVGGSIFRQLDVNFLGRAKYTPGLKSVSINLSGFEDVNMQNYFYGFEISTRLSYFNISFRYGKQINVGKINYWEVTSDSYYKNSFNIHESRTVGSIGITFNGLISRANNMLRLWNKPLLRSLSEKNTK
jgi:hypothetical protein